MLGRLKLFLLESREEFKRVNWPTRKEAVKMVFIVVALSLVVAAFLGAMDFILIYLLERLLKI
ncbi:preprotein translocase subunit SecE [Candidatus Nomurabacteria bacterium RIFCSPLOWO2_02_FULL_40_10]|uniref:Protein translocase subunit SecE n=1 Tax=Candidatus Nomurabacteria bacterium RIFCSPLOWO2_02_FULL_40_10 TaxID=1801786 RepID=A0A1F6XW06_9BACT|nr:MAG: preprotein translocase subunit SecE [Candidatus Nomurabacteria bacterium RIFCSPLOWO2_02_FULL_40_10]